MSRKSQNVMYRKHSGSEKISFQTVLVFKRIKHIMCNMKHLSENLSVSQGGAEENIVCILYTIY